MKTVEDCRLEINRAESTAKVSGWSVAKAKEDAIRVIQLDAMKEGMKRAANVVVQHDSEMSGGFKCGLIAKRNAILTAVDNLTERDLK